MMQIDASGWLVGRVVLAGDISGVDGASLSLEGGVDAPEYEICLFVPAMAFPPSFNHSFVVSVNLEVSAATAG